MDIEGICRMALVVGVPLVSTLGAGVKYGAPFVSASQLLSIVLDFLGAAFLARLLDGGVLADGGFVDVLDVAGELVAQLGGERGGFRRGGYDFGRCV